jgi:hypothetical protein
MTDLPNSIRVAGFDFVIRDMPHGDEVGKWGRFSPSTQSIQLDHATLRQYPVKYVDTMLHEIGHAICWTYGIEDGDEEERVVGTMMTGLGQVFRDNRSLLRWMQEQFRKADL